MVTKLLWMMHQFKFMHDMAEKKLLIGGSDELVDCGLKHKNLTLCFRLIDLLLDEGVKMKEESFCKLLELAVYTGAEEMSLQIDPGEQGALQERSQLQRKSYYMQDKYC